MIYLCAAPEELSPARQFFSHIAHAACHIDTTGRLRSALSAPCAKDDFLLLTAEEQCSFLDPAALCRSVKEILITHSLKGVAADFPPPATAEKLRFLSLLTQELTASGISVFVPEEFAPNLSTTTAVICTAMSGGFFTKRLEDAVSRFGSVRIALDVQRLMMLFPIPSANGVGTPLSHTEFRNLFLSLRPAVFFSRELCAKYFLCRRHDRLHLVLFDDISTLLEKLRIGRRMGISHFFFSYPEISDLLGALSLAVNKEKTL